MKVLLLYRGTDKARTRKVVEGEWLRIGRNASCEIHLPDPRVALEHGLEIIRGAKRARRAPQFGAKIVFLSRHSDFGLLDFGFGLSAFGAGGAVVVDPPAAAEACSLVGAAADVTGAHELEEHLVDSALGAELSAFAAPDFAPALSPPAAGFDSPRWAFLP